MKSADSYEQDHTNSAGSQYVGGTGSQIDSSYQRSLENNFKVLQWLQNLNDKLEQRGIAEEWLLFVHARRHSSLADYFDPPRQQPVPTYTEHTHVGHMHKLIHNLSRWTDLYKHTHNRFTALLPGPPGWAGARRELLDFMVQGKINRGRHTDHPAERHSIWTNQCPPPPSPTFFYMPDALPAAQPIVSKHWRQLVHSD